MSNGYYHQDERDAALNYGAQFLIAIIVSIIIIVVIVIAQDHFIAKAEEAVYGDVTTKWANPGSLYDAPFEYDSYIVHDRSNRQYLMVERQDGSWQLLQILDESVTNVTPNE